MDALPQLQPGVKVHAVMASLMDRLARYASSDKAIVQQLLDIKAFDLFRATISRVIDQQADLAPADGVEMYVALMNFVGVVHPERSEYVDYVLEAAHGALQGRAIESDAKAEKQLVALLGLPLGRHDIITVLGMDAFPRVLGLLRPATRKAMAVRVGQTALSKGAKLVSEAQLRRLLVLVAPLTEDVPGGVSGEELDEDDLAEEQGLVAQLLHALAAADPDVQFAMLGLARAALERGGPCRLQHTLPALAFCALRLARTLGGAGLKGAAAVGSGGAPKITGEALLQWVHQLCVTIADIPQPIIALRLLLACAYSASEELGLEMLAYDCFERALLLYEGAIPDAQQRTTALQSIIGMLQRCYVFGPDNRDALVQSCTAYCSRLLRRADQVAALCACSHLSWQSNPTPGPQATTGDGASSSSAPVRDAAKVAATLQRALGAAQSAERQVASTGKADAASYLSLYIDVLNKYMYYMEAAVEGITPARVQPVADCIKTGLAAHEAHVDEATKRYWANTQAHVARQARDSGTAAAEQFAALKV